MTPLATLEYWHWFIAGATLMIAETLLPGSFLIWFGMGALVTGVLLWAAPGVGWEAQLACFAVVSMLSIVAWRQYRIRHPEPTSHPTLNKRGLAYVGRRFTLADPIVDGVGRLRVDDTLWKITGPDFPAGTHVTVIGVEGNALRVDSAG